MHRLFMLLGICAAVALAAIAFGGRNPAVRADGGGSISGRLINDLDGDGDPGDVNEPGLPGWRVVLWKETEHGQSDPVELRTDRNGGYDFQGLAPGGYEVIVPCEGQPQLWMATWPSSYAEVSPTVEEGRDSGPIDFLLKTFDESPQPTGSISGRLTWDENRNGQPDPSEHGAGGWTVDIGMRDKPQCFTVEDKQATTSASGDFTVSGLIAGTYVASTVQPPEGSTTWYVLDYPGVTQEDFGWGDFFSFDASVEVPEGGTGQLAIGVLDMTGTGSISGEFYLEQNADGVRNPAEPLADCHCSIILGVRTLLGFAPVSRRLPTPADSRYVLDSLAAGEYQVSPIPKSSRTASPLFRTVNLPEDGHVTGVDFGVSSLLGEPTSPPSNPAAGAVTGVHAPESGGGPSPEASSRRIPFAVALGFAGAGAFTLASGLRRRLRRF
jgi:hypothetical protein